MANPARGLLNREKRTKEKVWQHTPPPTPHTARSEKINKITRRIYRRYAGGRSRVRTRIPSAVAVAEMLELSPENISWGKYFHQWPMILLRQISPVAQSNNDEYKTNYYCITIRALGRTKLHHNPTKKLHTYSVSHNLVRTYDIKPEYSTTVYYSSVPPFFSFTPFPTTEWTKRSLNRSRDGRSTKP